jgi:hypothetical protein
LETRFLNSGSMVRGPSVYCGLTCTHRLRPRGIHRRRRKQGCNFSSFGRIQDHFKNFQGQKFKEWSAGGQKIQMNKLFKTTERTFFQ